MSAPEIICNYSNNSDVLIPFHAYNKKEEYKFRSIAVKHRNKRLHILMGGIVCGLEQ
jgi:hypothetical protein